MASARIHKCTDSQVFECWDPRMEIEGIGYVREVLESDSAQLDTGGPPNHTGWLYLKCDRHGW